MQLHFDSGQCDQYILYKIIIIYYLSSAMNRLCAMQNVAKDKNLHIHDQKGIERQIAFQFVPRANAFLNVWHCSMSIIHKLQDHRVWREGPEGLISHFWFCAHIMYIKFLPVFFEVDFQHDNTLKNFTWTFLTEGSQNLLFTVQSANGDRMINNNV